jgi:lipid A 3-O-deacylase
MRKLAALAVVLLCACALFAQDAPRAGSREMGLWFGGGHSVPGGTKDTSVVNFGGRYGWVLTDPAGPGFLRGTFEYAVDAVPMYLVIHNGTTYGGGFNPLVLKWNFGESKRAVPWIELAGGTLFSTREVPQFTSTVNFRSGVGLGLQILGSKMNGTIAVRYEHISNAGLASPNPGINTVQFQVGINHFSMKKH